MTYNEKYQAIFLVYSKRLNSVYPIQDEPQNTYLEKGKQCLPNSKSETVLRIFSESPSFTLSWSHYLILMRIDNPDERSFYEIECTQQQWSVRQLSRQVGSSGVFTLSARQRLTTA